MTSSSLQIVERSANRLVILAPPHFWVGAIFLAVGAFVILAAFSGGGVNESGVKTVGVIFASPFLLAGAVVATSRTAIVLSRDDHALRVESHVLGIAVNARTVPLSGVRGAFVESNARNARALSIRLPDGGSMRLTGASTQAGYGEAAQAINEFLIPASPP
jgi:hypothetical protein